MATGFRPCKRCNPDQPSIAAGGTDEEIRFAVGQTSLGAILVASSTKAVASILLGDDPEELVRNLQDRFPNAHLIGADRDYEDLVARVVGFVETPGTGLNLPLDVRGTAFQQRVWQALQEIPAGETVSYAEVARRIGSPKAVRAVASACAANNLAVAIPCHRVVRTDGSLSGYAWGVERKRELIEGRRWLERPFVHVSSASAASSPEARVAAYDWQALAGELDNYGCAVLPKLLSPEECRTIAALYADESHFRSHVHMARHGFGKGEYRYFKYPLPGSSMACERRSIRVSQAWPTNGTAGWESTSAIPTTMRHSSNDATPPVRRAQRRFCCNMSRVTSTASIRISMAISHSRSRSRFSSPSPARTSQVASSS